MLKQIEYKFLSLAAVGLLAAGPILAAGLKEQISTTPGRTVTPQEEKVLSDAAARVLLHIAKARGSIHTKDLAAAETDLDQARTLLAIIKAERPTTKVTDHIWVAKEHLNYESTDQVAVDLIPIDSDLSDIEDIVPVEQAREHLAKAKMYLQKGDKKGAKDELTAVQDSLIYSEVDLPLAATSRNVIAAQGFLADNKPGEADKALKAAENGVRFLSVTVEAPMAQARKSLWKATKDYEANQYGDAKADLGEAETWLDQAAQSTNTVTHKEAVALKQSVAAMEGKVTQGGGQTKSALTNLWDKSVALSEREAEMVSTGWGKLRAKSTAKTHLINAKLHLAYAESAQSMGGKSAEVKSELDKAAADLNAAGNTSDKALKAKIGAASAEVKQIRTNLGDTGAKAHARYEKVKSDLRRLIRDL